MQMDSKHLKYTIALQMVPKVGPVAAKNLIAYCGSPQAVFEEKRTHLTKIPGIGKKLSESIATFNGFERVENELQFIEKHNIQSLYYLDENYPARLKDVYDAPTLLFYKGDTTLNQNKVIGIVGTRKATDYGKNFTEQLIEDLLPYNTLIVSGLAYGIDATAHKASVKHKLPTIGVMGTGMDIIYPTQHRDLAVKMLNCGGLVTEYLSGTRPEKEHFPARNRIVAGMVDALVLVETGKSGGALITAEICNSYNREVFALPGRLNDEFSAGCNHFIKLNKACLIESAKDIAYQMGWDLIDNKPSRILQLDGLNDDEKKLIQLLQSKDRLYIDEICTASDLGSPMVSMILLELEFKNLVQALPGKFYRLV